jgi:hypothetical protein
MLDKDKGKLFKGNFKVKPAFDSFSIAVPSVPDLAFQSVSQNLQKT